MPRKLGTLIYCRRSDDHVLLMYRHKEPNLGLWVGPGGKVELDESPYECALRELREETGLVARGLRFRALITETSPRPDWQWLLFIYLAEEFSGALDGDGREGRLRWWPVADVLAGKAPMPQADRRFFPLVIDTTQPFYQARYIYDKNLKLVDILPHPA